MPKKIYNLKTGHVLYCDFSRGFVVPEMVKRRPVVVISRSSTHGAGLCTVVPLSTTPPFPAYAWHVHLQENPMFEITREPHVWAKCDMLYTVSHERLDRPHQKVSGKRNYMEIKVSAEDLAAIFDGVRAYLPGSK